MRIFSGSLGWVSRDAGLIIAARGVRTFAQGYVTILIAFYFAALGFSLVQVAFFVSAGVIGVSFFAFLVSLAVGKVGRRPLLVLFTLTSAAAGLALVFVDQFQILLAVAFLGSLSTGGGGGGESPAQPLEVASLPDTAPDEKRTDLFAIYNIVAKGGVAFGFLAARLPTLYQGFFDLSTLDAFRVMFVAFAILQVIGALLYSQLSPAIEGPSTMRGWTNPLKLPSRRRIFTLTGLFSVDTFTTSMVTQTLMAYWFFTKFGMELESLALVFFVSQTLTVISLWVAAKIANRIGLLNTMVFTHIPSSLFLIAAVFAPTAWLAVLFWQFRAFLSQMDNPTRDSYTMAIVGPEERVAMASIHMVGRSALGAAGPLVTGTLWSMLSATVPLVGSAVLKISYDLALYAMFRNVRPPEEEARRRRNAPAPEAVPEATPEATREPSGDDS